MSDTKPEKRQHVPTDPGLGDGKVATDPGVAPPSDPVLPVVDRSAPTPPDPSPAISPSPHPVVVRFGGELTPVPPEDRLLSGLLESESEAYFRKTKPASESSGQAAAAFHGAARAVQPGVSTPLPEPPVMLRSSVELDIAEVAKRASHPEVRDLAALVGETLGIPSRSRVTLEPTVTLGAPRSAWVDKWIAFGAAAVVVAVVGILGVRWFAGSGAPEAASMAKKAATATPTATATATPTPTGTGTPTGTATAIPTPTPTPTPTESAVGVQAPSGARSGSKAPIPPPRTTRPRVAAPLSVPPDAPSPKDDVKRSM
jgi:hypothetical protein